MKLVKNAKVVKLPRSKGDVASTFRRALATAHEQEWDTVLIIGQGKDNGSYRSTNTSENELLGIMERVRFDILRG